MLRLSTATLAWAAALLPSWVEARVPSRGPLLPRQMELQYINASSNDNSPVSLSVDLSDTSKRNKTAPYYYGLMFEDINHSGDGGIYAELITNRAFQGSNVITGVKSDLNGSVIIDSEDKNIPYGPVLTGWDTIGNATMSLDLLHPLSDALPVAMELDISNNVTTGEVGFLNYGWWGMDVSPQTYTISFYALANAPRHKSNFDVTLSLRSNLTGETYCSTKLSDVTFPTLNYKKYEATIDCGVSAPNSNNTFAITMDASQVAGSTFYFDLISVFPETFMGRKNGLRKDIAQAFYDLGPKFLRFPGGNNLEGVSVFKRWRWWKTIGDLRDRPGRPADWSYTNTDGLGLLEFLEWTQDMDITPVLAVYAGFSLDIWGQKGTSFPSDEMQSILQEALDELEYCMGDTSTQYGALRASHGHPEPFDIKFIEIGNEDWFSSTYQYRWQIMYEGLMNKYPNITYISTTYNEAPAQGYNYTIKIPPGAMWDTHHYEEPSYFLENFNFYDNWQESTDNEDVGILLGEYSVFQVDTPSGVIDFTDPPNIHVPFPQLLSAIAEGVYAMGGERNPNTVKMTSYAPSLMNRNWYNWTPDMISFTANPNETVLSASYWEQRLFAHYRGTESLPVTASEGNVNPLYWASSIDGESCVYVKVINSANFTVPLSVDLGAKWSSVNGTMIQNDNLHAYNSVDDKEAVVPRPLNLTSAPSSYGNGSFSWTVPKFSITVLQFDL